MLLSQLQHVERQGKEDLERQKAKISQFYAQLLEDHKKQA